MCTASADVEQLEHMSPNKSNATRAKRQLMPLHAFGPAIIHFNVEEMPQETGVCAESPFELERGWGCESRVDRLALFATWGPQPIANDVSRIFLQCLFDPSCMRAQLRLWTSGIRSVCQCWLSAAEIFWLILRVLRLGAR